MKSSPELFELLSTTLAEHRRIMYTSVIGQKRILYENLIEIHFNIGVNLNDKMRLGQSWVVTWNRQRKSDDWNTATVKLNNTLLASDITTFDDLCDVITNELMVDPAAGAFFTAAKLYMGRRVCPPPNPDVLHAYRQANQITGRDLYVHEFTVHDPERFYDRFPWVVDRDVLASAKECERYSDTRSLGGIMSDVSYHNGVPISVTFYTSSMSEGHLSLATQDTVNAIMYEDNGLFLEQVTYR